jgi:hypothetical protein
MPIHRRDRRRGGLGSSQIGILAVLVLVVALAVAFSAVYPLTDAAQPRVTGPAGEERPLPKP